MITAIIQGLVLYPLAECQSGNATTLDVNVRNHWFRIGDDGRGHAIDKTINGLPYLRLVYTHFEYPFGLETDTPIQLHTIGMSLINALCSELIVTVYKSEKVYTTTFKEAQLHKQESAENQAGLTGTTVEGKINPALFPEGINLQSLEQWLKSIKSVNPQIRLLYNGVEIVSEVG